MKIIAKQCDPEESNDKTLPLNSYIVEYYDENGECCHDIVVCNKQVELFDSYYDKYRQGFKKFTQTEGRVNPKFWSQSKKK